jgi:hypothetical protein
MKKILILKKQINVIVRMDVQKLLVPVSKTAVDVIHHVDAIHLVKTSSIISIISLVKIVNVLLILVLPIG